MTNQSQEDGQYTQAEFEFPHSLSATQKTLGQIYFRYSILNRHCDKDETSYFSRQSVLVDQHEPAIRQFYEIHGNLKGLNIPGFNEENLPALESIIRVLAAMSP